MQFFVKITSFGLFFTLLLIPTVQNTFAQEDSEIPSWIKNAAKWWGDGQTTDKEFLNAIQWLFKEGILKIPGIDYDPKETENNIISNDDEKNSGSSTSTSTLNDAVYGPTKYLSFKDSPFYGFEENSEYFYLEDFENGYLKTPGVEIKYGIVGGLSEYNDSVDIDDGFIDGSGNFLYNVWSGEGNSIVMFIFDKKELGNLPTYAGLVFTDIGGNDGFGEVVMEAFDSNGSIIETIGPVAVGDGKFTGETGEDRFFGIIHNMGITAIKISSINKENTIGVDHLQYGR